MRAIRKGQSTLEYVVLLTILISVFISMQSYIKRGFQGRWKQSVDDLGDQYDPRFSNTSVTYSLISNSDSQIRTIYDGSAGFWTNRLDSSNSVESKIGYSESGAEVP